MFKKPKPPFLTITNHNQLIQSQLNEADLDSQGGIISVFPGIIVIDEAHLFDESYLGTLQKRLSINQLIQVSKSALRGKNSVDIRNEVRKIREYFNKIKNNKKYGLNSRHKLGKDIKLILSERLSNLLCK